MQLEIDYTKLRFNGPDYVPQRDNVRLGNQIMKVFNLMKDGAYRSLDEISQAINEPQASVSAQLRHLRKERFGGHQVIKTYEGNGLFKYKLIEKTGII